MRLEFVPRQLCVCGAVLDSKNGIVEKPVLLDSVRFVRCRECGSWNQSPQIAAASLRQIFDSEAYQGNDSTEGSAYSNYFADETNRVIESRGRYSRDLRPLLPNDRSGKVLEIGCATGSLLSVLRDAGCEVTGVDWSPRMARRAKELYGLDVVVGDVLKVTLPENAFDAVFAFGTLANFPDIRQYLGRLSNLLKPGGILAFNFVDAASPICRYIYRDRIFMFAPTTSTFLSLTACERLLISLGFQEIRIRNDVQQPSVTKLLKHAKLGFLRPIAAALGVAERPIPLALPIPAMRFVSARWPKSL